MTLRDMLRLHVRGKGVDVLWVYLLRGARRSRFIFVKGLKVVGLRWVSDEFKFEFELDFEFGVVTVDEDVGGARLGPEW